MFDDEKGKHLVPVLDLIAIAFMHWDPSERAKRRPVWVDGDWTNESEKNVALEDVKSFRGRPRGGKLGVFATRAEYARAYRQAYPERNRAAQRKWQEKQKRLAELGRKVLEESDPERDARFESLLSAIEGEDGV